MAVFNPQVAPTNDPNYFKYSEAVRKPDIPADKSTGLSLTTLGEGIAEGSKLAYTTAENIVKEDVRNTVEPTRKAFTDQLQTVRDTIVPAAVQTPTGSSVGFEDSYNSTQPLPPAVQSGVAKLQSIQSAFVQGKINDTYYHQQLDTNVQALRTKYPGFIDTIDSEVSKITGVNPANAVIADLMQDINRATSNKKTEEDKWLDLARAAVTKGLGGGVDEQGHPIPKANLMYDRLKSDPSFQKEFEDWYYNENAKYTRLDWEDKQRANRKGTREELSIQDRQDLRSGVSTVIDSDLHATIKLTGMDKPETIQDILTKAKNDPSAFSGPQYAELATRFKTQADIMRPQLRALMLQKGYTKNLTPKEIDDEIDSQLAQYKSFSDAIEGGGPGGFSLAFHEMAQSRAMNANTEYKLTKGPLGAYLATVKKVQQDLGPGLAGALIPQMVIGAGLPAKLNPLFAEDTMAGRAQADPNNPVVMKKQMDSIAADKRINPAERAQLLKSYVDVVKDFRNKDISDQVLENDVKYLFSPDNTGMLQHFKMDYFTTYPNGRIQNYYPGKSQVFTDMTDNSVTDRISKLSNDAKSQYRNWAVLTGREVVGEDVKNLNRFTGHDNISFEWKNGQINILDSEGGFKPRSGEQAPISGGGTVPLPDAGYRYQIQQSVDRINRAVTNLTHVFDMYGGNTEAMVLETLQQYGLRNDEGKITGLPKSIGDAIAASHPSNKPKPVK